MSFLLQTSLTIHAHDTSTRTDEHIVIGVDIAPVAYVTVDTRQSDGVNIFGQNVALTALPLGFTSQSHITAHDRYGRRFHATSLNVRVRPHRFDFAPCAIASEKTQALNASLPLSIHAAQHGDTVVMVRVHDSNAVGADFVRAHVADVAQPTVDYDDRVTRTLVRAQILCLTTPFEGEFYSKEPFVNVLSTQMQHGRRLFATSKIKRAAMLWKLSTPSLAFSLHDMWARQERRSFTTNCN